MESIIVHLNEAVKFVNGYFNQNRSKYDRDKWCHDLSNDILILDTMSNCVERKEMIIAIQNVLDQLDNLFENDKSPILISNMYIERSYLPKNKNSLYALGDSFSTL
jgi:hypothetical protein